MGQHVTFFRRRGTDEILTADEIRKNPKNLAREGRYEFIPIRPCPEQSDIIASVGKAPVIQVTDMGETLHSPIMRNAAFRLPDDPKVRWDLIAMDCVPRKKSTGDLPEGHPLKAVGYWLVLEVTATTWRLIAAFQAEAERDEAGDEWKGGQPCV
jgi:hypothetical protein